MKRNVLVDRLKGYACFLVVFGHVIMGVRLAGIDIPRFFEGMEKFIWSFHVALFLFLSGVVYKETGEWTSKKTKPKFILHKLLGLGVPYVVFSVVYIFINSMVGQANNQSSLGDVLNIWREPVAQYWFLYALFFLFCIWTIFSGVLKNWLITLLVVATGYILSLLGVSIGSFDVVLYSALAFGVGTFVDFSRLPNLSSVMKGVVVILHVIAGGALVVLGKIEAPFAKEVMVLLGIYASIMFISLLRNIKLAAKFFDFMNKYSFQTYLLHTIFTAGIRIVLLRVGVTNWVVHVLLGTVCGIACSVLVAEIAKRVWFFNIFFFPTKVKRTTSVS